MNAQTATVLAMGSAPYLRPVDLHPPDHPEPYHELTSRRTDAPLANRAIQGLYPTGSTFKPITATAALQDHLIGPNTIFNDTGSLKIDNNLTLHNAGQAINGPVNMSDALKVSSDIYFYNLGLQVARRPRGTARSRTGPASTGSGRRPESTCRPRSTG